MLAQIQEIYNNAVVPMCYLSMGGTKYIPVTKQNCLTDDIVKFLTFVKGVSSVSALLQFNFWLNYFAFTFFLYFNRKKR